MHAPPRRTQARGEGMNQNGPTTRLYAQGECAHGCPQQGGHAYLSNSHVMSSTSLTSQFDRLGSACWPAQSIRVGLSHTCWVKNPPPNRGQVNPVSTCRVELVGLVLVDPILEGAICPGLDDPHILYWFS